MCIRDRYVAAQLRDTGSVRFDTPLFRKLMQALEAIDFTELDPYEVKGNKVWEGDDANEFYEKQQLFTSYAEATPRSMGQSGYGRVNQPLILSLDGETEPIVPVSMTCLLYTSSASPWNSLRPPRTSAPSTPATWPSWTTITRWRPCWTWPRATT